MGGGGRLCLCPPALHFDKKILPKILKKNFGHPNSLYNKVVFHKNFKFEDF